MPRKLVTREELMALLGVASNRNFTAWEEKGLRYTTRHKKRGGKATHLYELSSALEWFRRSGSPKLASRAKRELERLSGKAREEEAEPEVPQEAVPPDPQGGPDDTELRSVWESILRIRQDEEMWARTMRNAIRDGDVAVAAKCEDCRSKLAKLQVDLYTQYVELKERRGQLISAEEAEGDFAKILSSVRNNILGVPDSAMPALIPHLRDPNEADDVKQIVTGYVHDALRAIASTDIFGGAASGVDGTSKKPQRKGMGRKR